MERLARRHAEGRATGYGQPSKQVWNEAQLPVQLIAHAAPCSIEERTQSRHAWVVKPWLAEPVQ